MPPKAAWSTYLCTVRNKLTLIVVVSVVLAVGLVAYAFLSTSHLAVRAAEPLVLSTGNAFSAGLQMDIKERELILVNLSLRPGFITNFQPAVAGEVSSRSFLGLVEREVTATPDISGAAAFSPSGSVLAFSGPSPSPAESFLARQAAVLGRPALGLPHLKGNIAVAELAVPIRQEGRGPVLGAEGAVLDLTTLIKATGVQAARHFHSFYSLILTDRRGTILYDSSHNVQDLSAVKSQFLAILRHHPTSPNYVDQFSAPLPQRRVLGSLNPLPGTGFPLYLLLLETVPQPTPILPALLMLAFLGLGGVALYFGSYRLTRPIKEAVAAARAFGQGNLDSRIPKQPDGEFQTLATAFNEAVANCSASFRAEQLMAAAQKEFATADSEEAVLTAVTGCARRLLDARLTAVFTPDPDGWLIPRAVNGPETAYAETLRVNIRADRPEGHAPASVAFRKGQLLSLSLLPPYPPGVDLAPWQEQINIHGLRYLVVIPLVHQNRSLGILACHLAEILPPTPAALEALQALAFAAAASLNGLSLREETMLSLASALEARDDETEVHALRVSLYSERLAEQLGIKDPEFLQHLRWGALLHDVGKIGLPDAVLRKPGPLTPEEWRLVLRHPEIGHELIQRLEFLGEAKKIVLAHHEHYDGKGYPRGLRGEEIPLGARIFAVADTFDAIDSDRPYRARRSYREALEEINLVAGSQLDPVVVKAFCQVTQREWEELRCRAEAGFFSRFRARPTAPAGA